MDESYDTHETFLKLLVPVVLVVVRVTRTLL
jgi:hypothetical protein